MTTPLEAVRESRRQARQLVERAGLARARVVLERAERELARRLAQAVEAGQGDAFTAEHARATLAQVRATLKGVQGGMKAALLEGASRAAEKAAEGAVAQLRASDEAFRGVGQQPIALDDALMFERADQGARTSLLRRLSTPGAPEAGEGAGAAKAGPGIMERYGDSVVGFFEEELGAAMVARTPWAEVRANLVAKSPFLQQAPAYWAERIVRTEVMGAYNRGGWEASREADEQLGDVVKILAATFDDRTAADSYAVHGQVRRVDEPFATWQGLVQHPPARPNDREIVVTHRIAWAIPPTLTPRSDADVHARWVREGRKGPPPPRPRITTVPFRLFGASPG